MNRTLAITAALTLGMVGTAFAAPRGTYKWVDETKRGAVWEAPPQAAVSNVIYLNNCKPNGCALKPGYDNATTNTSSIPEQNSTVAAFTGSDATWNAVVNCVKQTYADFDVQVVTTRPTTGAFHMAIVAGTPANVQYNSGVMGVSPFTCGYINNAISFTFANQAANNVPELCWTIAQETAHSWGLDHKFDNRDPMTYLYNGPTYKRFQNEAGSCGENSARSCECSYSGTGSAKMNSFALIEKLFGPGTPDVSPPTLDITYPTEGIKVTPGFVVKANVSDDRSITKVEMRLDGMLIKTLESEAWNFTTPASLSQGAHKVELTAYDRAGNTTKKVVNVAYGTVCTVDTECEGEAMVCLEGHCVAGPGANGGLGATCAGNNDCLSGQCASDVDGNSYCVEGCDPAVNACPSSFSCLETAPGAGVCWPSDGDGGGCDTTGGSGGGVMLLMLGMVGFFVSRKKRR